MENGSWLALVSVLGALASAITTWVNSRGKVSVITAEGDTQLRKQFADGGVAAQKTLGEALLKMMGQLSDTQEDRRQLQLALLEYHRQIMTVFEEIKPVMQEQNTLLRQLIVLMKGKAS